MMLCRRCGHEALELREMFVPRVGEFPVCDLCLDHLWTWLGLAPKLPPEPEKPPEPPFSKYFED